jgi:DNA-binding response OmpR family regulator
MSRKLLLADDSITIQKVVELVLSEEDFQIKAVNNGNDALNQVEVFHPDVVLADIEMPGVNGYQLCDKIKKNSATAHISVLLLAGAFEPLDEDLAKNVRADDYIVKPFESQELINKINAVLTTAGTVDEAAVTEAPVAEAPGEAEEVHEIARETVAGVEAVETVEVAESAGATEEDLWAMGEAEPLESKTDANVWEIDEGEAVAAESVEAEMAEMDMAAGVEEVHAVEEVVAQVEEPEPSVIETTSFETPIETVPYEEPVVEEPVVSAHVTPHEPVSAQEVQMPSSEEVTRSVKDSVKGQIGALVGQVDVKSIISESIKPLILESVEKSLHEVLPELLQSSLKEMLQGSMSSINKQIENVVWETVPDLAENIIKKEIEKIKSES